MRWILSLAISIVLCTIARAGDTLTSSERLIIQSLSLDNRPVLNPQPARVDLGRALFHATSISPSGRSCAACHPSGGIGADSESFRPPRMRRSPILMDVAWNKWYFWDGRATSLETAVLEPLFHEAEIGASPKSIRAAYRSDPALRPLYNVATGGLEVAQLSDTQLVELTISALADYLRTVQSRQSRFDQFARMVTVGQSGGLSDSELRGLRIFIGKGNCIACHNGWRFSDGEFHNLRLLDVDGRVPTDSGRMGAVRTLRERFRDPYVQRFTPVTLMNIVPFLDERGEHFGQFKTPGLRNLQDGSPLMHQGQFRSIRSAVLHYSEFSHSYPGHGAHDLLLQPLRLISREVDDVVAFLKTLGSESQISK